MVARKLVKGSDPDVTDPILEDMPTPKAEPASAANVAWGKSIPAVQQILLYSPGEWESFIHEWVHSQKTKYTKVLRVTGSGDMGIDIAGCTDASGLRGVWDNFQCKHYDSSLTPTVALPEIAKVLWYSFNKKFSPPQNYYFISPRGCGIKLSRLLDNGNELKRYTIENWGKNCAKNVTSKQEILLEGKFKSYVDIFDFSIFSQRSHLDIIDDHRTTPYHAVRFGGGLPPRPAATLPPENPETIESTYVRQIFEAYSDHMKADVSDREGLSGRADLVKHFDRQREFFYHAEGLRNFARDNVPLGTFEDLQGEVHSGVADVDSQEHKDALDRLNAVTQESVRLQLTSNPLIQVVKIQDRKGICHQLANENRLRWKK